MEMLDQHREQIVRELAPNVLHRLHEIGLMSAEERDAEHLLHFSISEAIHRGAENYVYMEGGRIVVEIRCRANDHNGHTVTAEVGRDE